ncbi:hypothetical protein CLOM_g14703 [Closterium sp. NIES-68]|nr:hypothetical protein CLOM_g14703 [Closterium sp. NIES-68]
MARRLRSVTGLVPLLLLAILARATTASANHPDVASRDVGVAANHNVADGIALNDTRSLLEIGVTPTHRASRKLGILPFPGFLKCALVAYMDAGSVQSIFGGDPGADGVALVQVYRYNGRTNVNIRLRAHALSSSPITQTVNKAYSGSNGLPVWVVSGQWSRDNNNDVYTLQKWYYEANKKYPPGSTSSVYSIVRAMAADPRRYYALVSSLTRPLGAIRGQFRRTLPFLLYPWNPC